MVFLWATYLFKFILRQLQTSVSFEHYEQFMWFVKTLLFGYYLHLKVLVLKQKQKKSCTFIFIAAIKVAGLGV